MCNKVRALFVHLNYWKRVCEYTWKATMAFHKIHSFPDFIRSFFFPYIPTIGVAMLLLYVYGRGEQIVEEIWWIIGIAAGGIGTFCIVFICTLLQAPSRMEIEAKIKHEQEISALANEKEQLSNTMLRITKKKSSVLELHYKETDYNCHTKEMIDKPVYKPNEAPLIRHHYKLGISNRGAATIKGVVVTADFKELVGTHLCITYDGLTSIPLINQQGNKTMSINPNMIKLEYVTLMRYIFWPTGAKVEIGSQSIEVQPDTMYMIDITLQGKNITETQYFAQLCVLKDYKPVLKFDKAAIV